MSPDELEEAVTSYLERLEAEPELTPEAFAQPFADDAPQIAQAIHGALAVRDMLPAGLEERPQRIGAYRVLHELGRGGMGIVYTVERDGRSFALKLLPFAVTHGERGLERFRREAQVLGRLRHPGIVAVVDSGSHEGSPYIVMELVDGEPLTSAAAHLGPRDAARIVRELALAVQAAHDAGVLHRDLKPQNVMLRRDGRPVLLDFGLVRTEDEDVSLTSTGDVLGTLRYMAPEQALGRKATARTDVYGARPDPVRARRRPARALGGLAHARPVRGQRRAHSAPALLEARPGARARARPGASPGTRSRSALRVRA